MGFSVIHLLVPPQAVYVSSLLLSHAEGDESM